jgi:hypothetical protein
MDRVAALIDGFEDPFNLELLSTVFPSGPLSGSTVPSKFFGRWMFDSK